MESTSPRPRHGAPRLDAAVCRAEYPDQFTHQQFANNVPGFKKLVSWLKKQGAQTTNSFLGMEHTGHYTLALCCFLQQVELPYTMISPLELKRSMGLARGKNDRVDAKTVRRCGIAQFTCLHGSGRPSAAAQGRAPALGQPSQAEKSDGLP